MADNRTFVGRRLELASLDDALQKVRAGRPQVAVVRGEPGFGKTALVRHWLRTSAHQQVTVLRARCDTSEADLSFGAIEQLVSSAGGRADPNHAMVQQLVPTAAPFQIGAKLLRVLDDLQNTGPVVLAVDDAQWTDTGSAQALGFVLRRLEADAVLVVLIHRTTAMSARAAADIQRLIDNAHHVTTITLPGLTSDEMNDLAQRLSGRSWNRSWIERLRQHTGGSPLYAQTVLTELMHQGHTAGHNGILPVPASLTGSVQSQLASLPDSSRWLAEAAAVLDGRPPLALVADVAGVEDGVAALEPLVEQRLLQWWPNSPSTPVALSHTLHRDAILAAIKPSRLRQLHIAAAERVSRDASWRHLVAAAVGPSDVLAADLERAAAEHTAEGALGRASTLLLWAADLPSGRGERERRLLTAAAYLMWGDDFAAVTDLLPAVRECEPGPLRSLVLGAHAMSHGAVDEAEPLLSEAIAAAQEQAELRWAHAMAATWLGMMHLMDRCERSVPILREVLSIPAVPDGLTDRAKGNICIGVGFVEGARAGLSCLEGLVPAPRVSAAGPEDAYCLAIRGLLSAFAGEYGAARSELATAVRLARESACSAITEFSYNALSATSYFLGDWDAAVINSEHGMTAVAVEDKPWAASFVHSTASWVAAGRGHWASAEELLRTAQDMSVMAPGRFTIPQVATGRAVLAQARGDHAAMLEALLPLLELPETGYKKMTAVWWAPLHVEALIGTGRLGEAEHALKDLQQLACRHQSLQVVTAWLTGWLAERRGASALALATYQEGLAVPSSSDDIPLHRGLLELAYGRILQRRGDLRGDGVAAVRHAWERFHRMDAVAFRDRCEFVGPMPKPRSADRDQIRLTDRERGIANLVSRGYTNREIATELFISSKTVEYHLGNIFARCNVRNRRELRDFINGHARFEPADHR